MKQDRWVLILCLAVIGAAFMAGAVSSQQARIPSEMKATMN